MTKTPDTLIKIKSSLLDKASPRRAEAINAIFSVCSIMLEEGLHISVVSVGDRTSQIKGGPTARTIYNTADPYGNLVQAFVEYQSSQKPGEILAADNDFTLPSLSDVLDSLTDPAHKAVIREFEHNAMKTRDRMRILEGFISKLTAQDVAKLTCPAIPAQAQKQQAALPKPPHPTQLLSDEDKKIITDFFETILFDEGYELHDGDVFHAQTGRSLRAEAFVSLLSNLGAKPGG